MGYALTIYQIYFFAKLCFRIASEIRDRGWLAGQSITVAVLREHACALDMLAHLISGGVLFPLGYLWIASHVFPGPPVLRGMLWAGLLWDVTEVILVPLLGTAIFSTALGGMPA